MLARSTRKAVAQRGGKRSADDEAGVAGANKRTDTKGKQPYPASRLLRDSARLNKRAQLAVLPDAERVPSPAEPSELPPPLPPLQRTLSSKSTHINFGMLTREEFAIFEEQYLSSLDVRKQTKALISQEMFDKIWLALHYPKDNSVGSPQFRWWVRKMFRLAQPDELEGAGPIPGVDFSVPASWPFVEYQYEQAQDGAVRESARRMMHVNTPLPVVVHDEKRVAIREQIYDILCVCHERVNHGGRDKTATEIRKSYTWVPKDLIALFVKNCPTCICKRTGQLDERASPGASSLDVLPTATYSGADTILVGNPTLATCMAQYISLPANNLIADPRSGLGMSPGGLAVWSSPAHPGPTPALSVQPCGGSSSSDGSSLNPYWRFASAGPGPGPGYVYFPPGAHTSLSQPLPPDSVRLPSIMSTSSAGGHVQPQSANVRVTLPSLSQVFSRELTLAAVPVRTRQPLQALPNNVNPFFPLSVPLGHVSGPSSSVAYVPQIDPALLQDGVHMHALAAEAEQAREMGRIQ